VATVAANVFSCVAFGAIMRLSQRRDRYPFQAECRWDFELIRRMLRYGLPNGLQMLVDIGAYLLFVLVIGQLGTVELAATNLAFNLNSLAFIPMLGLGTAVLTLVGRRIGEGRPEMAARTTWRALWLSQGYMLAFAALYLLTPDWLLAPYAAFRNESTPGQPTFEEIRPAVTVLLRFVAAYSVFDAMAIVFGNAIRGAGDTRFSLLFTFVTGWFLMALPAWLAVQYLPPTPRLSACWWAATANISVLGVGLLLRFQGGKWRSMRVIEHDAARGVAGAGSS
jgi:MATE family multidrug resistance protein